MGCTSIQQRLATQDCECEAVEPCESPDRKIAHAVAEHEIDSAQHAAATEKKAARAAEEQEKEDQETDDSDVIRSAEELAQAPVDPTVPESIVEFEDEDDRKAFQERHDVDIADDARVFQEHFADDDHSAIAVHNPGESLEIYSDRRQVASLEFDEFAAVDEPHDELPVSATAIDLVRDQATQLKLVHSKTDDDDTTTYYVGIYKLIGSKIGTIFFEPVAIAEDDGSVELLADIGYLHGLDDRIIEWIPVDDEPTTYEWNHWEGVYHIPEPPPTAPTDEPPTTPTDDEPSS